MDETYRHTELLTEGKWSVHSYPQCKYSIVSGAVCDAYIPEAEEGRSSALGLGVRPVESLAGWWHRALLVMRLRPLACSTVSA